jgi:HEAT repeat protein
MTREQMLDRLRDHVAASFKGTAVGQEKNLFLLDRLDNVRLQARDYLADRLREWASDTDVRASFVLAARGWDWAPLQDALHLELAPLRDDHIQAFLQENLAGDRADLAWTHIARSPLTLDMARDAFFLESMVRAWKQVGEFQPFANPTSVIGTTVRAAAVRKVAEKAISDHIDPSSRNHVLSVLGYRQVEGLTSGHSETTARSADRGRLVLPRDLEDLQASGYAVAGILREAEVLGILSDSGLRGPGSSPAFAHDLLRDYFAASYLRQLSPDILVSTVNKCLEFFDWDEPILMLVELLEDAGATSEVVLLALSVDAALGCECVARARRLLGTTMVEVLQRIARHEQVAARRVHGPRSLGEGGFSLSAALSRLDETVLQKFYASAEGPALLRAAVPAARAFKGLEPAPKLGSPPPGDRAENFFNILQALYLVGTPEAFDYALSLLRTFLVDIEQAEDPVVLLVCLCRVFWRWRVPGSFDSLLGTLEKDQQEPILDAVAPALCRASGLSTKALRRLSCLLDHPNGLVVSSALEVIGRIGGEKAIKTVSAYIRKLLALPPDPLSHPPLEAALRTLARISPHAAESLLRELLVGPEVFLGEGQIFTCVRLLGELSLPESLEALLTLLVTKDCEPLYGALARFRNHPGARKRLEDLMRSSPLSDVQDKAAIVLGLMGHSSAARRLLEILQRPFPPELEKAERRSKLLARLGSEATQPPSVRGHWSKCCHAAEALGLLGQQEAAPAMLWLVKNEHVPDDVRQACLMNLGRVGYLPALEFSLDFIYKGGFPSLRVNALVELAASVSLDQCVVILQTLKRESEKTQDDRRGQRSAYADNLWQTGLEVCERRRRRFRSSLGGWPLGIPPAGEQPLPLWLREVAGEL